MGIIEHNRYPLCKILKIKILKNGELILMSLEDIWCMLKMYWGHISVLASIHNKARPI